MVSSIITLPVWDQLADQLPVSLLALNCGDYCENHTFDINTVLFAGGQHLRLVELDCDSCCYPFCGFRSLFDWQLGQTPVACVGSKYTCGGRLWSTVRLFERTEEFDACKSSWTKTAVKVKKSVFLRYEVSRFLVSIQTWCVVLLNTFKITSL